MTTYGYIRVSTDDQALSVEAQSGQILARYPDATIVIDQGVSGTTPLANRPGFSSIEFEPGDTLVAIRLDRIARSTIEAATLLNDFETNQVNLVLFDLGLDFTSPSGRLVFSVLAAVAAFERDMIAERTKEALFAKRDTSTDELIASLNGAMSSHKAAKHLASVHNIDISPSTIQRRWRERRVP